jgi:hypothetical protein
MFGLRAGGIGVLNPANLVSFLVCPEPVEAPAEAWSAGDENGRCNAVAGIGQGRFRSANDKRGLVHPAPTRSSPRVERPMEKAAPGQRANTDRRAGFQLFIPCNVETRLREGSVQDGLPTV